MKLVEGMVLKLKDNVLETQNFKKGDLVVFIEVNGRGNYRCSTVGKDKPVYRGIEKECVSNFLQDVYKKGNK